MYIPTLQVLYLPRYKKKIRGIIIIKLNYNIGNNIKVMWDQKKIELIYYEMLYLYWFDFIV